MKKLPLVYIAGPYTKPDPIISTRKAIDVGMDLYERDLAVPMVPHVSLLMHLVRPQPVEFWYEFDLHLLDRCDAILRLPGFSVGADAEVEHAARRGMPVFYSVEDLEVWCRAH